jgi:hypothetical protein
MVSIAQSTRGRLVLTGIAFLLLCSGCTRYQQKPLPIRLPSTYPNATEAFGATIAAVARDDKAEATDMFGFDILGAGVLPIQVIFDHQGTDPVEIVPSQTFLTDPQGQLWNILQRDLAYNRIEAKTEWGEIAPEAGKGALLGAAAGAIIGAAVGIVTGENVLTTTGKGAAVGGAGGAVLGGAKGHQDPSVKQSIREDLRNRSLENKPIPPQGLSHGVLFFPAEALGARTLRLQLRDTVTGETRTLTFAL